MCVCGDVYTILPSFRFPRRIPGLLTFEYLEVVLTSDERWSREIDTRIGEANSVLRERYCSVVTKQVLSNNAKLLAFKSVFVPIFTRGNES